MDVAQEVFFRVYIVEDDRRTLLYTTAIGDRTTMLDYAKRYARAYIDTSPNAALTIQEFAVVPGETVELH